MGTMVGYEFLEVGRMAVKRRGEQRGLKGRLKVPEARKRERKIAAQEGKHGMAAGNEEEEEEEEEFGEGQGEGPSNLHPATAPDLGRTNH